MKRYFFLLLPFFIYGTQEDDVISLLRKQAKAPKDLQIMLSIAEGYKSLGLFDSSMRWYEKTVKSGGKKGEAFAASLLMGKYYEEKKENRKAEECYKKAIALHPESAEPFYHLAKLARAEDKHELCSYYAKEGKSKPFPEKDTPLISKDIYQYLLDEELSIAAYYTPEKQEGFQAVNRLLLSREAPSYMKNQALSNALFYVKFLEATLIPLGIDPPRIDEKESYAPTNPTIQRTEEGYEVICRTVNYSQQNGCIWSRDRENPKFTTRNFFLTLDKEFNRLTQEEIIDHSTYPQYPAKSAGNEDCRLFSFQGDLWFTCALLEANPSNIFQAGLGRLTPDGAACEVIPLKGPDPQRREKNWLPFVINDQIHLIYSYDPLTILLPDLTTGECQKVIETTPQFDGSRFRGSAGPIPFDDGYLTIVHEVHFTNKFHYLHRFVYLNSDFQITKLSPLFYFKTTGVEFCSGMTYDHEEKNLVLTLGVEDREAYIALIGIDNVRNQLSIK